MTKVVHVIDDLGTGGAQRQLVTLLKGLDRRRFAAQVIGLSTEKVAYAQAIRDLGIPLTLISHSGKWSCGTLGKLVTLLRSVRPDVVHTWLFTADLYGRLAARATGAPGVISTVRSIEPDKPWHYVLADRFLKRWTHRFIVNAQAVGGVLAAREGVPSDRIALVYNGLDLAAFSPAQANGFVRKQLQLTDGSPVVGIVGRLSPVKDHETFLRAAARVARDVPSALFLIVGDGELKVQVKRLTRQLALTPRVLFMKNPSRMPDVYSAMDLLVVSSLYEGCSNVILEAMAMAKPVVATSVGGNPELVIPGETGLLVPPKDPQRLARSIVQLITDPRQALQMGTRARQRVLQQFDHTRMVRETERVYEELVK